ncbi:mucin-2-like [Ranitomeya imitator]|uniref:mucin-2-like n=1 Tax=Ranitomeya imitator TaxID=111125 RepID=UPI0037E977FC
MGVLHIVTLSTLCLLSARARNEDGTCFFNGKTFQHGETVSELCLVCECVNGELADCELISGCTNAQSKEQPADNLDEINYYDEPEVFESSDSTDQSRKKRSLGILGIQKSSGNQVGGTFSLGGALDLQGGNKVIGGQSEVKTSIGTEGQQLGGGFSFGGALGLQGGSSDIGGQSDVKTSVREESKEVKVNASLQLGGISGFGVQGSVGVNSGEDQRIQDELRKISEQKQKSSAEINLNGGNLQLPNINVGGILGQQGGKIQIGGAGAHGFGINGNQEINGGFNINGINQEAGGKINLEGGSLQLPNLKVGGIIGQQGGKIEIGGAGEAHAFGINGKHEINGGFSLNGINQEGGGKINLEGGNLQLPNLNAGGILGQQGGKIEVGGAGEAHGFGISGNHEISGGLNINGINQEGGGKINLEGGNLQLPNLNVGGILGQQGGKIELGNVALGINGNQQINGGLDISNGISREGGKQIINLKGRKIQVPDLHLGGAFGQQSGKIEFGGAREAHSFGINGKHEINGGFSINGINQEGGGKINLEGGNLQLPNLNVGGILGQQGGKIELGGAGGAHGFGINGKSDINGGLNINGISQEGGGKINLESGNLQFPNLNVGGILGQQGGKIEFGKVGEAHAFGINGKSEINGGLNINGINQEGGTKINLEGGNLQLPNLNVGGILGQQGGKIELGNVALGINGNQQINGGLDISSGISREGGKQIIDLKGGKIQVPDLHLGGAFGQQGGKIEVGGARESHSFGINGKHEINGGFSISGIKQEGGGKINLEGGNLQLPNLNVGGILGQQGGKIELGGAGGAHGFGINGKSDINGGLNINGISQEGGGKINLEGGNLQFPNLNVGGILGQQGGKIEFGKVGEAHAFGINGKSDINGGLNINGINQEGGTKINLEGGNLQLPNLNVGGILGQQGGKIELGNVALGINGNQQINGGLDISSGISREGGKQIIDLKERKIQVPDLHLGGAFGQQGGKIEFGGAREAHSFGINGKHEINGGFSISGINQEGGGKINLEGGNLQIPNLNVGGILGQQGGKIDFGGAGGAHAFGINGNQQINGGLDISNNINGEGGKPEIIDLKGGKIQVPDLHLGGAFGQQGGKIEFGGAREAHSFGINGKHEINGGFSINGIKQEGGGKINLEGGNQQQPNLNVGGILGQQSGRIEFGGVGEAHGFGINGNQEINGGLDISSNINGEGGKQIIDLKGGKIQLPDLHLGGAFGQQGGKIEFGGAREAHSFGINGKHEINGGFSINGINQEGGAKINLEGGNLQLPNLNVGGVLGQQGGKIEFGGAGGAHAFGINGNHEINGGLDISKTIDLKGGKIQVPDLHLGGAFGQQGGKVEFGGARESHSFGINGKHEINGGFSINGIKQEGGAKINLEGGNLQLPNLKVGGILGQQGGKIEFGGAGGAHGFGINGNQQINGGLDISSDINGEGGKQTIDLKGGKIQLPDLHLGGAFGQRGGKIEFGGAREAHSFGINGKHEINGGFSINGIKQEGGGKINLEGGNLQLPTLNVGGILGQQGGKIEFGGVGGAHAFGINGNHEINGGLDISSNINGEGGKLDLKGGNLNVGGVFGQHGGKFEFGNGGETRTFEIHGRHEFNGGFGKSSGENNSEGKHIKFGGKFGHGHGSIEQNGKIDINIKGGNNGSSEEKSSEDNKGIKFGGKFGHGHGSVGAHGKIDVNIKGGNKGSSEEKSSEENKGIKFGGKFGHGHGSIGAHGKIDVNIKGGNKGSSEENSSEGNKGIKFGGKFGHGHGSIKQNGKIDINIKGRSEESSEEKSSEEKNEHNEKSSFEDIDLDFGTAPTYNPEFTIEPMIIPQTAQLLFQGPVTPNLPVEPEVPVNTPEPEAPVHPEILVVTPEPEAPVHPEILVATPEPEAPVHPEILVATPEPEAPVQPEIPVATPEPEAPVIPEEPEQPVPVTESPPSSGKSCTFYAKFVLHGQTEELACSTCTCDDGSLTCVKNLNCPGVCSVIGLQMIRTFDGTLYESPGNCDYVLVKTSDFTISLDNELCSELGYDNYNPDATCIKSVDIYMPQKATIKLLFDGTIQSAGEKADLPYSILDTITVLRSSSVFLDVATPLFNIQYDWVGNRLYVILDQSYKDHTAGLCGTYNDNRNDDYRSSNDMTETVSSFFTKSWKTQYQCSEDTKDPEDIGQKADADWACSDALDNSLFEDCALLIDTHSYKISCSSNVYHLNDREGLCAALADYAYRCARAGIFVPVSSSFPDCSPVCKESMVAITDDSLPQQDCAEYTSKLLKITPSIPLNEVCICPTHLYYDASLDECVKGDFCPCYNNNRLYKLGEIITQADGQTCPCERITQCGDREEPPPEPERCSDNEIYADCQFSTGKLCEPSCMNLAILDTGCSFACTPGCVCKSGFLRSSEGNCVPLNQCPCIHGDEIYVPGATLAKDCNTCTCENGKFSCTNNTCNKVCNAYGGSQFFLFDNVWKSFDTKQCPIVLVESREGETPVFKVVMQNAPNEVMGGALLKKTIHIVFGGATVVLSEFDTTVIQELGSRTQLKTYRSGFYQVVHFLEGLAVYYDQHLDVIIQLAPQLQGKVQGMCGDADGTTTTELAISNMAQYGSQFLTEVCPDQQSTLPPPSDNHKKFVETRCSLLKGDEFSECHTVVNVDPYYVACVEETEACREGESCLCYCTALAAYARACCRKGITIDWRTPDTCPSPCEYYNRDGGEGPYRIVMMNGKTLVIDYDNNAVSLENVDVPGNAKASFMVTPSLYVDHQNGRKLISLESAQHHNYFIVQNDDETLSLRKWQPSVDFRKRATFILRSDRWVTGYDALESYTSRGLYLSIYGEALVMSKVKSANMLQMNFKLIEENFGLPSFSICTWKYRSCGSPCIATCQDPLGTKCTLTLKVEGCYPICAPGMVLDEVTHRCVHIEDCVTPPVGPSPTPIPTSPVLTTIEACRNVICKIDSCADGQYLQEVPSSDPCCPKYVCIPIPPITTGPPTEACSNVVCNVETCADGEYIQLVDSSDPCCPKFQCFPTLPPVTTTPPTEPCSNVVCSIETCADGEYLQLVDSSDPCCPKYQCFPILPPVTSAPPTEACSNVVCTIETCADGEYLQQVDSSDPCCPKYQCFPILPPVTTAPPTEEPCKNVLCEPPVKCTKNGAGLVEIPWENICCPRYECQCQVPCNPPPICQDLSPPFRIGDPDVDCCPAYECIVTPITTPPPKCAGVTCPTIICTGDGNLVEVASEDPCCQRFECFYPEPIQTPTPNPCDGVTCAEHQCPAGENLLVKQTSDDPCCPAYECVPSETTPPPVWTPTPGKCDNVICQTVDCFMTGSKKVLISVEDCCPVYDCECEPCSPAPACNGNKPIMTIDPEMDCCPKYKCPEEATPPPKPTPTTPAPTTSEPCKDVLCEPITCDKKGSTLDIIPWAESCCPHFVCVCKIECDPPICYDGRPPVRVGDPDTECCPEYKCEPPLPPCENVICPVIQCAVGEIAIEYDGDDPCCRQTDCVPITPVPTVPPTAPSTCDSVTCIVPECRENEKRIVKIDSDDPCCPLYECAPPPTPPSTTPEIPNNCSEECPVIECHKIGTIREFAGGDDPCCPQYKCVCQPCDPAPNCGQNSQAVIKEFDIDSECCPTYDCITKIETTTPIIITTPIPTPDRCLNILCEPLTCTKQGATVNTYAWADECCPHYVCECTQPCSPIPQCQDGIPPIRTQDPEKYCCPEYICQTPTQAPTTPELCTGVNCFVPPCDIPAVLVEVPGDDHCCKSYECIPPATAPPQTTEKICDVSLCEPNNCDVRDTVLVKVDPVDGCCPVYQCIPPTTTPPETTPTSEECEGVVCQVEECTKEGSYAVSVGRDECCETYACVCQPCSPSPICENLSVTVNVETHCCPIYECPPPPPTPTIPSTTLPNPCENRVCEPITCTKQGATAERREWADPCCPLFVCECTEQCSPPPECQDGRPPFRIQDPELYCCPEYECLPPTLVPPVTPEECQDVTCVIPTCRQDYSLIEVSSNDPCCKSYECNPPPTVPPTTEVPPCDFSGCSPTDCDDGYTLMVKHNPEDDCCPSYECIPPPTPPPPPPTPHGCEEVVCSSSVEECTKAGAVSVVVGWENKCCPIYQCQCQPCSPAPACENVIVIFDPNTQCCPSFACPPPTPTPTPVEPCSNRVCEPITCTKQGATAERREWADPCCPLYVCECTEQCSPPPECQDGRPPFRTQDPELYCCPEYECLPPTLVPPVTPEECQDVTCVIPTCRQDYSLIEVSSNDPCCKSYECNPPPTAPPTTEVPPCDFSGCSPTDCDDGYTLMVKHNPEDDCCPSYECIPPPTPPPPPPTPHGCEEVVCSSSVEECTKAGAVSVVVGLENKCCPIYQCQCQPCSPAPACENVIVIFDPNTQCCPSFACPPPTPTPTPVEPCSNRVCEPITCTKQGATAERREWADPCCPLYVCECTEQCSPPPECQDGRPPFRTQDPELYCCPEYECLPPTLVPPVTPEECQDVTCVIPTCRQDYSLIEVSSNDPCCKSYECNPPPTVPPTTEVPPCDFSGCSPTDCDDGYTLMVKHNPEDDCCPSYECIPPPTPPPPPPTPHGCEEVVCSSSVEECTKAGAVSVVVGWENKCCPIYQCQCQPCSPAPACENVIVIFDPNTQCCPSFACPPPTPTPTPVEPCSNRVCEPITCTKQGATAERREWADPCCPLYVCECTEQCSPPPECQDGRPPFRTQDPELYCCPEYECLPPTLVPPVTPEECQDVTCVIPTCRQDYSLIEVSSNDPCCKSYECNPPPTVPPTTEVPPCDFSGCSPTDCDDGYTLMVKHNPEDDCCPSYECIPPPTPPPPPPTPHGCEEVVCSSSVEECTKAGAVSVVVGWENKCCPIYQCQCQPCSPAPACENVIVIFDPNTQCCPSFACPPPTPTPTPVEPCSNRVCEPITCTKQGATAERREWADPCCPLYVCECTEQCSPPPECQDGRPPFRTQDPELYCCPEYECLPPTLVPPVTPEECQDVTCVIPTCRQDYSLIEVSSNDPCCKSYECNPPPTVPPTTEVPPCDFSGCSPTDCDDGYTLMVKHNPEDDCCPSYECIPPPTPPPPPPTPHGCEEVVCSSSVEECTKAGAVSVVVGWENKCCPIYQCQCQPCSPAPACENVIVIFDPNTQCCPSFACPPPTPTPTPVEPCSNRVCEPITCTKQGATAERREWADPCCPLYVCECTEQCSPPPECQDGRPPFRTQDPELYCCPEYECLPPTLVPPVTPEECQDVTCVIPTCRQDYSLIEVSSNDPCCKSYECNPPPTAPPTTEVPPCDFSGCSPTDCDDGYTLMVKYNPEDDCCPTYECIPPPTPPPPPPTPHGCEEVVCSSSVEECTKAGAVSVVVGLENKCCPIYQCQCQPCSPAPACENVIVIFDPNTQCCPSFVCPPPTPTPTPVEPCSNRVCEPITCTKQGATAERREWADPCCPLYVCECTEQCSPPPECQDGRPPFRTQDPELYCCPEYECLPPTLEPPVTPRECQGVTCVVPPCYGDSSLVEVSSNDPCCKRYQCIPPPEPPTPTPSVPPCDFSGCSYTDCDDGYILMVKFNPDDDCCPLYECIPSPTSPPPPPTPCEGVVCNVEECTKEGAVSVAVGWENDCCPVYQCQCQPCSPPPNCGGENLAVHFDPNIQCCPIYECVPPTPTPTPTPKPNPCENRVCEPLTCTKNGATIEKREWADPCCPLFVCECTEACSPPPECQNGQPPFRTQDPELYCCPVYECVPPTSVPVTPGQCDDVTCTIPTCYGDYTLIRVSSEDPCCDGYECIPPPTVSPPTPKPPCDASGCAFIDCDEGYTVLTKYNPDDDCCPTYVCIPPPTSPPETTPDVCSGVVCNVKECTKEGTKAEVVYRDNCCDVYECKCQPCSPPPYCDGQIPFAAINTDTECCPTYECPPPPPPTPTIPITTTPNQCQNRVCEPVTCSKQGATPELREWADPCCPLYVCQCTEQCSPPPECQDGRPPFRTQDPKLYCCPEYACLPPTLEPPVTPGECQDVTCFVPPCYGDSSLVEVSSNDPCCKSYQCIPPPTIPPPITPRICDGSGCPLPNCDDRDTVMSRYDPDDDCCPTFECIPPSTTPVPRTTPPHELCKDAVCEVTVCTKEGEIEEFIRQDECCEVHECRCQPCSPPPLCDGGQAPSHFIDTNTQCCPSYQCPPPTPPPETTPPIITITPENPCNNILCEPVVCTKVGATVSFSGWIDACCPQIICECKESCDPPPTCANGSPPLRTQDPEEYCCPEYECVVETTTPVPTTTLKPLCQGVTCFVPTCGPFDTLVEVTGIDPCCTNYECVPPVTNPPPPTPPICVPSQCPNAPDCSNGVIIVKSNPYDPCCPLYECIVETTPNPITTVPSDCGDVSCDVKACTKEGETLSFVGWLNHCCRDYECKCQPCNPPPNCDGGTPIANINLDTQCCPTYICGPPPPPLTTEEAPTTIISSTSHGVRCEDRECPVKVCNEQERLVTHINPADPCCPIQTCECACKTIPSCESDERLVAVQQSNQCCPKLRCEKKRNECYAVPTHVTLSSGQCSAEVILASCSGYCHSKTEYSATWTAVSHCRCCSVTKTQAKTFELPCPGDSKTSLTVQEASECGCNKCSEEDGSGSGSGSSGNSGSSEEEEGGEEGSGFSLWSSLGIGN